LKSQSINLGLSNSRMSKNGIYGGSLSSKGRTFA
jgi:hypothetical protein